MHYQVFGGHVRLLHALGPCQLAFTLQGLAIAETGLLAELDPDWVGHDWQLFFAPGEEFPAQLESQSQESGAALVRLRLAQIVSRGPKLELAFEVIDKDEAFGELLGEEPPVRGFLPAWQAERSPRRVEKRF